MLVVMIDMDVMLVVSELSIVYSYVYDGDIGSYLFVCVNYSSVVVFV